MIAGLAISVVWLAFVVAVAVLYAAHGPRDAGQLNIFGLHARPRGGLTVSPGGVVRWFFAPPALVAAWDRLRPGRLRPQLVASVLGAGMTLTAFGLFLLLGPGQTLAGTG